MTVDSGQFTIPWLWIKFKERNEAQSISQELFSISDSYNVGTNICIPRKLESL